ncbi:MAG: DUF5688 family protein [Lachnospiraceae bacterium]|nr:DUF5688 family protein [Lachnospiraceae bacterium]
MSEILKELMHDSVGELDFAEPSLYVLTNSEKLNGAALLLDAETMDRISDKIGKSYYILPSSVHETIFVPASITESQDLSSLVEMVVQINPNALNASNTASSFLLFNRGTIFPAPTSSLSAPHLSRTEHTLDFADIKPIDPLNPFPDASDR